MPFKRLNNKSRVDENMQTVETKKLKINTSFIINALRNCGYTNYTAIADIIDNSLEKEVASKKVQIVLETTGSGKQKTMSGIVIADDGCGMPYDVLEEAMSLGAETGKDGKTCLGMYGTGLKTASLSIGQRLEVYTKCQNDKLKIAVIDIENLDDDDIFVDFHLADKTEINYFSKIVNSSHGTLIRISKLDKLSNKDVCSFRGTLKRMLGETFNKFIDGNNCTFLVDNEKIKPIYIITPNAKILNEKNSFFIVNGKNIKYNAYFIPKEGNDDKDEKNKLGRFPSNSGLYIYRQNRLVGRGLKFGLFKNGDGWYNGFRCEIFVDGTCDMFFNSTFTKMISEKDEASLHQSFKDALYNAIGPLISSVLRTEKEILNNKKSSKEELELLDRVAEQQNANLFIQLPKTIGKNEKQGTSQNKNKSLKKQEHPNSLKKRNDGWCQFDLRALGKTGMMYDTSIDENGKIIIVINTDHTFYENFFKIVPDDVKFVIAQLFSCQYSGKVSCQYYTNSEVTRIIDEYNLIISETMRKSMDF